MPALLPVSLVFTALCALVNLWLMVRIGQVRRRERVWVGDAGSDAVVRRMRAQANFVESAPFAIALVVLIELCAGSSLWLALLAGLFVVGRIAHPFGMNGAGKARMIGAASTMLVLLVLALWAIAIPVIDGLHMTRGAVVEAPTPAG